MDAIRFNRRCRGVFSFATVATSLITFVPSLPAMAENASYNLDRTISEASRASDDLKFALKQLDVDRSQAGIAGSRSKLSVSANGAASQFDGPSRVALSSAAPPIELLGKHSEDIWLAVVQPIDVTGQVSASVRQARIQTAIDELAVQQLRNSLALRSKKVYYDVLRAKHRLDVAQSALASATAQQTLTAKLVANEMGQKIDLRRADTQVAGAQQELTRARADLEIANQTFNDLVGQPFDAKVVLDDVPGVAGGGDSGGTLFEVPATDSSPSAIVKDVEYARTHRPDLLSADLGLRASRIGVKLARVGLDPTVSLSATAHYLPTTSFMMPRDRTAEVSLMVSIPLYDGGATSSRIAQAKARQEQADISLAKTRKAADLDVRQSRINVASSAGQIASANAALTEATLARRLAQTRYEGQVGLYLEVTDTQAALVAAQNNQVNAVYDYLIALAQLDFATARTIESKSSN